MRLGEGWLAAPAVVDEPLLPEITVEDLRTEQILLALTALQDALIGMPAPIVQVDAPDLSAIVTAVTGLKPGADAEDIARAVVKELGGQPQETATTDVLRELAEAMKDLDFRMKGIGRGGGGGGSPSQDITDRGGRQLGVVTVGNPDGVGLTDTQLRATPVPVSGTVEVANDVGNPLPVSGPTLTKGTQGATGFSTQDLKDAGRSSLTIRAAFTSTAAAETAVDFQTSAGFGAASALVTSYTVTAAKRLRLQTLSALVRAGGTTPVASTTTLRMKINGEQQGRAFVVLSPASTTTGPTAFPGLPLTFPDGIEVPAGGVVSFTVAIPAWTTITNTPIVDIGMFGYEY